MSKTPVSFSRKNFTYSFKKKHPDVQLVEKEIDELVDFTGKAIADILVEDGEIKLGSRLGTLMIRKFKPKGKGGSFVVATAIDHVKSNALRKPIYQLNDHSDGYIYKFVWNKRKCKSVSDKNMWIFKPIRSIKRRLAPLIRSKEKDYPIMIEHLKGFIEHPTINDNTF